MEKILLQSNKITLFEKLLEQLYETKLSDSTYRHLYRHHHDNSLEILIQLTPNPYIKINIYCHKNEIALVPYIKNYDGQFIQNGPAKIVTIPQNFDSFLQPVDFFKIFATNHIPFNIYHNNHMLHFFTSSLKNKK